MVGGFNPSEKYESQVGWICLIHGKIENGPNHQADIYIYIHIMCTYPYLFIYILGHCMCMYMFIYIYIYTRYM